MNQTALLINQTLPILLLIGLGAWIRRSRFLSETTMDDLKRLVIGVALPAALFLSFLEIRLEVSYLAVFGLIFVLCVGLYFFGLATRKSLGKGREYYPFLTTGFEYGMLGVSLFGSAWGLDKIGYIAVIALGHEVFIWFVFLSFLLAKRDGAQSPGKLLKVFVRSPVIIAIFAGLVMNILVSKEALWGAPGVGAVMTALKFLAGMTIPLILLIVGHGIRFEEEGFGEAVRVALIRLCILIPTAFFLNAFFIRGLLGLGKPFEAALFTLLILPPPFIIPLYMRPDAVHERRYVLNALTINTVLSLIAFGVYLAFNPIL
jgi:malate permease and related proteins